MAETYRIDVELKLDSKKLIILPERIEVPKNSIIEWNIKDFEEFYIRRKYYRTGLLFNIYFDNESPFSWKKESLRLYGDPLFPPFYDRGSIKIAEGIAENKGDFKYGIKVIEIGNSDPIYDEDPYILVF